ncbi:hypothetical protein [Gillisia sp. CAL575]|uniref:hypothetical protein n=1 Tax=Gillisia sp. CAL575 TaxID=985255 RepID=UPI000555552A|nr:hypothetical protein [Gillisia sp. CAL575]
MKLKKIIKIVLILFLFLSVTSCAPTGVTEQEYGFFSGMWHGLILPFSSIGSLFNSDIGIVATANNGIPYYSGWGVSILISLGFYWSLST